MRRGGLRERERVRGGGILKKTRPSKKKKQEKISVVLYVVRFSKNRGENTDKQ